MLVLIPRTVNYFYNLNGRRIAEALRSRGVAVDVAGLRNCPDGEYDWCVLVNISEVLHAYGPLEEGLEQLRALGRRCGLMATASLDSVRTMWFGRLRELCAAAGVPDVVDLGLYDQTAWLPPVSRPGYYFVCSGLTPSERSAVEALPAADPDRPIPWAFVGHATPFRTALADFLVENVDPQGFLYLPTLAPYTETDSPHLTQEQFEAVLRRARYQVWCSHHFNFYMEPERFRTSLLTGSVPVKVLFSPGEITDDVPFSYLLAEVAQLPGRLRPQVFEQVRRRFREDFLRLPSLSDSLADYLVTRGVVNRQELATPVDSLVA